MFSSEFSSVEGSKKEEKQSEVLITENVLHVQGLYSGFSQNNIDIFVVADFNEVFTLNQLAAALVTFLS